MPLDFSPRVGDWLRDLGIGPRPHVTITVKNLGKFLCCRWRRCYFYGSVMVCTLVHAPHVLLCVFFETSRTFSPRTENSTVHSIFRQQTSLPPRYRSPCTNGTSTSILVLCERVLMLSRVVSVIYEQGVRSFPRAGTYDKARRKILCAFSFVINY